MGFGSAEAVGTEVDVATDAPGEGAAPGSILPEQAARSRHAHHASALRLRRALPLSRICVPLPYFHRPTDTARPAEEKVTGRPVG